MVFKNDSGQGCAKFHLPVMHYVSGSNKVESHKDILGLYCLTFSTSKSKSCCFEQNIVRVLILNTITGPQLGLISRCQNHKHTSKIDFGLKYSFLYMKHSVTKCCDSIFDLVCNNKCDYGQIQRSIFRDRRVLLSVWRDLVMVLYSAR